jgi:hypothetical protein
MTYVDRNYEYFAVFMLGNHFSNLGSGKDKKCVCGEEDITLVFILCL